MSTASILAALQWYLVSTCLTAIIWPFSAILFPGSRDRGWAFARCISAHTVVYVGWLLGSSGLIPWGVPSLAAGALIMCVGSVMTLRFTPAPPRLLTRASIRRAASAEVVFAVFFIAVMIVRSWKPEIYGLEKFMNWAFMNSIANTTSLPPIDPWFAGLPINYYYFGHVAAAGMTLFAGVDTDFGYNLMFCQIMGATGVAAFALIRSMLVASSRITASAAWSIGFAGATMILFGGNLHSVIYGVIRPSLVAMGIMSPPTAAYHFPMSTRFIGFNPPTSDKAITEFPSYALYMGELHAHVINLAVTFALLTLCAAILTSRISPSGLLATNPSKARRFRALAHGGVYCLMLALSAMANTWDLPMHLMLLGMSLLAAELFASSGFIRAASVAAAGVAIAAAFAIVLSLPFWWHFQQFAQGLDLPRYGSTMWQWAILYGNHASIAALACVILYQLSGALKFARKSVAVAALFCVFAGILLTIPEVVSVKDIYGSDYQRSNTMFKTSFQAYAALDVASPVFATILVATQLTAFTRFVVACFVSLMLVPQFAYGWLVYDQFLRPAPGKWLSLNGRLFLAEQAPGDWYAVEYLRAHRPAANEAILEASGDSYTMAARISAATGIPTVLGWHVHQWLWRGGPGPWQGRASEISRFYGKTNQEWRREFINRYRIRYIIIGQMERQRYSDIDVPALSELGTTVMDATKGTMIIEVNPTLPTAAPKTPDHASDR